MKADRWGSQIVSGQPISTMSSGASPAMPAAKDSPGVFGWARMTVAPISSPCAITSVFSGRVTIRTSLQPAVRMRSIT